MDRKHHKENEYHKLVWKTAKQETKSYFQDWWAWIGGAIVGVVSGGITTYVQNLWSEVVVMPLWFSVAVIVLGTLLGTGLFVVVLYGWNGLWQIPAKLYREKQVVADKLTWNDINIKLKKFQSESIFTYGIVFESEKPFIVNHIFAEKTWYFQDHEYKSVDKLPLIFGKQYVWDEGVIDDKGGKVIFSLFNVRRDYPEAQNFRALMPKSGQPNDGDCSLDIVSTMQDKTLIEIAFSCTVENMPIVPAKIKKNYKVWFENGTLLVEEYTEK